MFPVIIQHNFFLKVVVELGRFEKQKKKGISLQDLQQQKQSQSFLTGLPANLFHKRFDNGWEKYPIMLWWSPLTGENGRLGRCGDNSCFFTINRTYLHHPMTKAVLFYGMFYFFLLCDNVYMFILLKYNF